MSDKTKEFQEFIKQDFNVVEDYKESEDMIVKEELHNIFMNVTGVQSVTAYDKSVANIEKALSQHEALVKGVEALVEKAENNITVNFISSYDGKPDCKLCKSLFEGMKSATYSTSFEDIILQDLKQLLEEDKV